MQQRDTTLDACRGLAMMYIVCVIHVAYWLYPVAEPLKSVLLFEMPAMFFIAGAAQSLRGTNRCSYQPLRRVFATPIAQNTASRPSTLSKEARAWMAFTSCRNRTIV